MECELCGSKNATRKTKIDSVILATCEQCTSFGQELARVELSSANKIIPILETGGVIVPNFNELIRKARSDKGLTQEDAAKMLNEKSSILKRIEDGWEPPTATIKKLEKFFGLRLIEEQKEENVKRASGKSTLTIGDIADVN
ncbi:MAG: multiprotein-bridging factor 1 family protein [Candidatus Aenigmatarchaeota archaeon]